MRTRYARTAVLLVLTLAAAACPPHTRYTELEPEPPLRVGITPDTPPLIFVQDGEIVGVEADLARALAQQLDRSLRFVRVPWPEQIPALLDHRTDIIMSGMSVTIGRQVRIAFSEPYLHGGLLAMMRRRDKSKFDTRAKVLKTSEDVGVRRGTTSEQFVEEQMTDAQPVTYLSHKDAVLDLKRGRIALFVDDAPVVAWLVSEHESEFMFLHEPLKREALGWGMRRGDTQLRGAVDEVVKLWKRDGTLDDIVRRWMPYYPGLRDTRQLEDSYEGSHR